MNSFKDKFLTFFSNRHLILSIITCIISITYIVILFNLQVINGEEYREKSQKKMLRNVEIVATRGEITDRYGVILATSKLSYNAEIYKITCETDELNKAVLEFFNILDVNGDNVYTTFPINSERNAFSFKSEEEEKKWKEDVGIEFSYTFEDVIEHYSKR